MCHKKMMISRDRENFIECNSVDTEIVKLHKKSISQNLDKRFVENSEEDANEKLIIEQVDRF